jgi:hypothetical protein
VEDIYDEFSFGQKSAQAVKDFLKYAGSGWGRKPRFVIFAGDATFDPRNYLGLGNFDLVPTRLVPTIQMEASSDDWFADFNDDELAEMAIGRLPVRTAAEAQVVISKIVSHDASQPGPTTLLVNDRNDGYNFQQASRIAKGLLPKEAEVVEVDRVQMDDASAKAAIMSNLNSGPKLVNYLGHGSLGVWNGSLLTIPDARTLTNREQLSVFMMMTCLNGLYQDVSLESLGEVLLKLPGGGAVAVWASSGMTEAQGQAAIDHELFRHLFGGGEITLGEAIIKAKAGTGDSDVRRTWVLLGDPSMKLR